MKPSDSSRIVPGNAPMGGINLQVLCDVDPEKFRNGLEVLVSVPGAIAPMGHFLVASGCLVCVLPPDAAKHVRSDYRKHAAHQPPGPGEVKAPGLS